MAIIKISLIEVTLQTVTPLSKVFYRTLVIPLTKNISTKIQSKIRSWVLQDCFEKSAAHVLYRKPEDGGLGLLSVQCQAISVLLRAFCKLSADPCFIHSLNLETLFWSQVLGEFCAVDLQLPPYYNVDFLNTLKYYNENLIRNIAVMTIKEWYQLILDDRLLMSPSTTQSVSRSLIWVSEPRHFLAKNLASSLGSWSIWIPCLPSVAASSWPAPHSRLCGKTRWEPWVPSPRCVSAMSADTTEDLYHVYFRCENNWHGILGLLMCVQQTLNRTYITAHNCLFLNLDIPSSYKVAIITMLATDF